MSEIKYQLNHQDLIRDSVLSTLEKFNTCCVGGLFRSSSANKKGYTKRTFILFLYKLDHQGLIEMVSNKFDTEMKWALVR